MFKLIGTTELNPEIYLANTYTEENNPHWFGEDHQNIAFNHKVYEKIGKPIKVLELGCGGGLVVEQFLKDGNISIGLDGHPAYSTIPKMDVDLKKRQRSWYTIPQNLFRCDIGKPFQILYNNENIKFDLIHSWECFEHVYEKDIPILFQNINQHSHIGTIFIGSISTTPDEGHITLKDSNWWNVQFANIGFYPAGFSFHNNIIRDEPSMVFYMSKNI